MTNTTGKQATKHNGTDANRDPITGTPGAHKLGTGVGASGGAAAGGAMGAVADPAGAAAGGLAGKEVAEKMEFAVENGYWKTNGSKEKCVERNVPYATYQPARRTGHEGPNQYPSKKFEEVETNLQRYYENSKATGILNWVKARSATRDAWNRVERALPGDADVDGR